jgi:hypothetical protein
MKINTNTPAVFNRAKIEKEVMKGRSTLMILESRALAYLLNTTPIVKPTARLTSKQIRFSQ